MSLEGTSEKVRVETVLKIRIKVKGGEQGKVSGLTKERGRRGRSFNPFTERIRGVFCPGQEKKDVTKGGEDRIPSTGAPRKGKENSGRSLH